MVPGDRAYEGKRWKGIGNGVTTKASRDIGKQVGIQATQFENLHLDWKTSVDKRDASTNGRLLGSQTCTLLSSFLILSSQSHRSPLTRTSSFSPLTCPAFISSHPFVIHFSSPPSTSLCLTALPLPLSSNPVSCIKFLLVNHHFEDTPTCTIFTALVFISLAERRNCEAVDFSSCTSSLVAVNSS